MVVVCEQSLGIIVCNTSNQAINHVKDISKDTSLDEVKLGVVEGLGGGGVNPKKGGGRSV